MRAVLIGVVAAMLGGCAPAVRDRNLAGLDLADGETLAALQAALAPDDRGALGTYALLHWPKSKFYCGRPISGRGSMPTTIGEAIDQTRAYEARLAAQTQERTAVAMTAQMREKSLIDRMEQLVLERDKLYGQLGPAADRTPQGAAIKNRLESMRGELGRLRSRKHP